ncbi:hypothetical protein FOQG_18496 [Fusarium oxysporum f. sp. raphani 54005]|uniref:Uncharacterized protein n=1 Tax=Fusarium oxysporum f. sp. raphani 54005 TaxID=1089458 RepID=X0BC27_FUSOX|nr:hypothetical protein FOQG_18881 [Fusarium oxysporum f. sp. raphani 54005]EXK76777.1 hypothetical protein FOQG_18496 [Fusarium oxysporum f. sp. raphani 54005]
MMKGVESSSLRRRTMSVVLHLGPAVACGYPTISLCKNLASRIAQSKPTVTSMLWRRLRDQL